MLIKYEVSGSEVCLQLGFFLRETCALKRLATLKMGQTDFFEVDQ